MRQVDEEGTVVIPALLDKLGCGLEEHIRSPSSDRLVLSIVEVDIIHAVVGEIVVGGPRSAISLAEPIAPLCRPDCPGLCETCGLDLTENLGHEHPNDEIDPRLAALAGIREQLN